ncbi:MAG: hypothetical protein G01um101419_424 [Parcubacteria group bacterium Gr01-1014_19]|nr:MAG: hypothetical protein G01um101419_424 [Parcubacteria group bacterium Gr01-1014_19]
MPRTLRLFRNSFISDEEYEKRISDFQMMLAKTGQKPESLNGESVAADYYDLLDKKAIRVIKSHLPDANSLEGINFSLPVAVMEEVAKAKSLGIFRPDLFRVCTTSGEHGNARIHAGVVVAWGPSGNDHGSLRNCYLIAAWGDEVYLDKMAAEFKDLEISASKSSELHWARGKRALLAGAIMAAVIGGGTWWKLRETESSDHAADQLFQQSKLSYVDTDINEEHFPDVGTHTDFKVYQFDHAISSEEAIEEMKQDGYQPANLRELLLYAQNQWDGEDWMVALGQSWRDFKPYLGSSFGDRELNLESPIAEPWKVDCRFLAVRK